MKKALFLCLFFYPSILISLSSLDCRVTGNVFQDTAGFSIGIGYHLSLLNFKSGSWLKNVNAGPVLFCNYTTLSDLYQNRYVACVEVDAPFQFSSFIIRPGFRVGADWSVWGDRLGVLGDQVGCYLSTGMDVGWKWSRYFETSLTVSVGWSLNAVYTQTTIAAGIKTVVFLDPPPAKGIQQLNSRLKRALTYSDKIISRSESDGIVITLPDVVFEYDSAEIRDNFKDLIRDIGKAVSGNDVRVVLKGYTDNMGTDEYNVQLSRKRAESVAAILRKNGVQSRRIECTGYGRQNPLAPNDTYANRQKNRRVEIRILSNE